MKRIALAVVGMLVATQPMSAGDDGVKKTIAYVQKLQTDSGGFRANDPKGAIKVLPTLRATSAAIRALKYWEGDVPNKDKCINFVERCWDAEAGAFADEPKGKPDVFTTAVGLMAVVELKMPADKYVDAATKYLESNAKTFEEIRIAVAGFEAIKKKTDKENKWLAQIYDMMDKKTGAWGMGTGTARDTASAVVTLMRLGDKLPEPQVKVVRRALNDGQRQSGGWGKADSETASDLETTYRVMRCYMMLKAKPGNIEGVRSFVAKCRNSDGGYAVAPGQPSSVSGTYFAGIVLHWVRENPK